MQLRVALLLLLVLSACATSRAVRGPPQEDRTYLLLVREESGLTTTAPGEWAAWPALGDRLVVRASRWVGLSSLRRVSRSVPDDCSGLIRLALAQEGVELENVSSRAGESLAGAIHRRAVEVGAVREGPPLPGDLVFFRNTYDRNRDGRLNDGLTHVGLVEAVDQRGTVTFIHRGHRGVRRARVNPSLPKVHRDAEGQVLNDYLRRAGRSRQGSLSGALFEGFAKPGAEW